MDLTSMICMVDCGGETFFAATKVLLDTGAGQSVFRNQNLLRSVVKPSYAQVVKGVDSAGQRLRDTGEGSVADLLITVSVCAESVANLLSVVALRDAGCTHTYSQEADHYTVETPSRRWTFERRTYITPTESVALHVRHGERTRTDHNSCGQHRQSV